LAADEASAQPLEAAMSRFSDAEISCVASQRLGRLAAVRADGLPHVVPVSFRYNPTRTSTIGRARSSGSSR
jgi:nitroimidazol reductase NimA-like FMN-containing flavoprotein (pyridoxamine 5'-phosphate oxidase superfamily)